RGGVQREPAVGGAGERLRRVVHKRTDGARGGQPPQVRGGCLGHAGPGQAGNADDHHVPGWRGFRGPRRVRWRGRAAEQRHRERGAQRHAGGRQPATPLHLVNGSRTRRRRPPLPPRPPPPPTTPSPPPPPPLPPPP